MGLYLENTTEEDAWKHQTACERFFFKGEDKG